MGLDVIGMGTASASCEQSAHTSELGTVVPERRSVHVGQHLVGVRVGLGLGSGLELGLGFGLGLGLGLGLGFVHGGGQHHSGSAARLRIFSSLSPVQPGRLWKER